MWEAGGQRVSRSHKQKTCNRDSSVLQTSWREQNISKHLRGHIFVPDSNRIFMGGWNLISRVCFLNSKHHRSFNRTVTPKKLQQGYRGDVVHWGNAPRERANPRRGHDLLKQALNSSPTRGNLRWDAEGDVARSAVNVRGDCIFNKSRSFWSVSS